MTDISTSQNKTLRAVVIAGLLVAAFFGAYRFASVGSGLSSPIAGQAQVAPTSGPQQTGSGQAGGNAPGGATSTNGQCACCGGQGAQTKDGVSGDPVEGTARLAGGIQVITVKVGTTYSPNIIRLKAGIPAEITFGQGGGCTSQVVSRDLGFSADLSAGPHVVRLAAPKKGTYAFSCGMGMVLGQIVVE